MVFICHEFKQHCVGVRAHYWGGGLCSNRPLPRADNDLGTQLHLALQKLCVEPLQQLLFGPVLLGLEAREAPIELTLLLFGRVGQGLHNSIDHLVHVLSHHRGPLGFLYKHNLGCDSYDHLVFH